MGIVHTRVDGIDAASLTKLVEGVLLAHSLEGVELFWLRDPEGRVLRLTVEHSDARLPGEGVTLDLCSRISRELSQALDDSGLIDVPYRLEVGSPGLERALYRPLDYQRFVGQMARVKLAASVEGQRVIRGTLVRVEADRMIVLEVDGREIAVEHSQITEGQLLFDWKRGEPRVKSRQAGPRTSQRERNQRASTRSK